MGNFLSEWQDGCEAQPVELAGPPLGPRGENRGKKRPIDLSPTHFPHIGLPFSRNFLGTPEIPGDAGDSRYHERAGVSKKSTLGNGW